MAVDRLLIPAGAATTGSEPAGAAAVVMPEQRGTGPAAAISWRQEFVRAYVEHAGDRPASERLTLRWPTLITVCALVSVASLVIGVFWSLVQPLPETTAAPVAGPNGTLAPGAATTWSAVAGWDCPPAGDHGFDVAGRGDDWRTAGTGGWTGDGCHGTYETVTLSAARASKTESVTWWFSPPPGLNTCAVAVFVPRGGYRPATKVKYAVEPGRGQSAYANFTVDQKAHAGDWASAGTFPVNKNQIAVALVRGGDAGAAGSRIALAQMKVTCAR